MPPHLQHVGRLDPARRRLAVTVEMSEALRQDRDRDVLIAAHNDPSYEPPRYTCRPDPPPREQPGGDGMGGDDGVAAGVAGLRLAGDSD